VILGTIRGRIIANSAVVLVVMAVACLYTGLASSELARSVELLFRNNLVMEELSNTLDSTEASLSSYLMTKSSDSLKDYIRESTRLADGARKLNRSIKDDEVLLLQRDISGLVADYLTDAEACVAAKRGRDIPAYTQHFQESERTAELIRFLASRLEGLFLADSVVAFSTFDRQIGRVIATNAALVIAAALMGLMLLVRFSYTLTGPLSRLAEAARAIGRGEYDHELPALDSSDEVGTMAAAFSSMQESVKRAFAELRSKSEVEKRLMEERMRGLDMEHKLKDAELLALQTQINPHFLFNTLQAGMQLSMVEGADRTTDFLEKLAGFIRYALKPPSRSVLVSDEIECVARYIWLLKLRFGERFDFSLEADDAVLGVETPALLLQPLVENSVGHGLRDREGGGRVEVSARVSEDGHSALLTVSDTGVGMEASEVERLLREGDDDEDLADRGIGLRNVIRRVKLATRGRGAVELESRPGEGTTVRIRLPMETHR